MFKNNTHYITLETHDLTPQTINSIVNKLYKNVIDKSIVDDLYAVQLQLKVNNTFRSISKIQVVNATHQSELSSIFNQSVAILYAHYNDMGISQLFIRYSLMDPSDTKAKITLQSIIGNTIDKKPTIPNLPKTVDLTKWGVVIKLTPTCYIITSYIKNIQFIIDINKNFNSEIRKVQIMDKSLGIIINTFEDNIPDINKDYFIRTLGNNSKITYNSGVQVLFMPQNKIYPIIPALQKDLDIKTNYVTLDLETVKMSDGNLIVESVAVYNGVNTKSWHMMDYSPLFGQVSLTMDMFKDVLNYLINLNIIQNKSSDKKWLPLIIYVHNFSGFDAIFLIKFLVIESDVFKINRRDGKIISIIFKKDVYINGMKYKIHLIWRDSYLMLPSGLKSLAQTFGVTLKGDFDTRTLIEGYDREKYRNDLLKYNELDCVVLFEVMNKYSKLIFDIFHVNIHKYPTVSSIAFAIWRTNFLDPKSTQITISDLNLYKLLREGYTGGAVDVFTPMNDLNTKVYGYDINSVYPYVMSSKEYPVGSPIFFEGSKDIIKDNLFGFLNVEITTPNELQYPLLQKRVNNKTITPVGTWTGIYFTEELKLAIKMGYKIKVLSGVLYNKKKIFSKYVQTLYDMRLKHPKGTPINLLCKLLMNSLYGKFGMDPQMTEGVVENKETALKREILPEDFISITDDLNINFYSKIYNQNIDAKNGLEANKIAKKSLLISLPIAIATTSYARIELMNYKLALNNSVLYTDTDSIFSTKPLPLEFIGNNLGQMKLEYTANKCIFICPKVYGLELEDGSNIIKIKGSKPTHNVTVNFLGSLLKLNESIELYQEKWFRDIQESEINIVSTVYTLKVTENKRQLIYINNIFKKTSPHILENGQLITGNILQIFDKSLTVYNSINKSLVTFKPDVKSVVVYKPQYKSLLINENLNINK